MKINLVLINNFNTMVIVLVIFQTKIFNTPTAAAFLWKCFCLCFFFYDKLWLMIFND